MGDIEIKSYIIPKSSLYGFNHTFNAKYDNIHVHKYKYFHWRQSALNSAGAL